MKTLRFGATTVDRAVEMEGHILDVHMLLPTFDYAAVEENRDWLEPHFWDDAQKNILASMHTYVIRTPHHTILVDTCVGNDKPRTISEEWNHMQTPWLDRLAALGVRPEEVDYVLCTHLHVDHVGWNTRLEGGRWVPTFPKARYLFHRAEFDAWEKERNHIAVDGSFDDSVLPVVEAGQAQFVAGDHAIDDTLWLEPTPGHSPGHVVLHLQSGGAKAVFTGDMIHHPIQIAYPEWNSGFCSIPELAREQRQRFVQNQADTGTIILPAHFAAPVAGCIASNGNRWKFAVEEAARAAAE